MLMTQKEFAEYSGKCSSKEDWKCCITDYACKDYLCPELKKKEKLKVQEQFKIKDKEIGNEIEKKCKTCDSEFSEKLLIKVKKCTRCPKCGRELL